MGYENDLLFYLNRANTNYNEKNYVKAIELLTEALNLMEKWDELLEWKTWGEQEIWAQQIRADCYLQTKEFDKALQDAEKVIKSNSNVAFPWAVRGEIYSRKNENKKAIEDLTVAVELNPGDTYAIGLRGSVFLKQNMYTEALTDFKKCVQLIPNDGWAIANIGMVYKGLGNYSKAIAEFEKALEADDSMDWVKKNLLQCKKMVTSNKDKDSGEFDDEDAESFWDEMDDIGLTDDDFEGRD